MAYTLSRETFMYQGKRWARLPEQFYESWTLGVDLGQSLDFTACAAVHHSRTPLSEWAPDEAAGSLRQKVEERFDVRGLQRFPLGTSYVEQVSRVQELLTRPPLRGEADLVIDQTGPGAAVGDLFAERGLRPVRVLLTGGIELTRHTRGKWGVPKSVIISNIDARLHTGELRIANDVRDSEALKDELQNFQRHVTQAGRAVFEARSSRHDDLILAIGIALWWALERRKHQAYVCALRGAF
jgi:hypothetical protein